MSHIRIFCRGPRKVGECSEFPSWQDVRVFVIGDEGTAVAELTCVQRIQWSAEAGNDVPTAWLQILGPELDVEADGVPATQPAPAQAPTAPAYCYDCGRPGHARCP